LNGTLEHVLVQARKAKSEHSSELIVYPELFLSGYDLSPSEMRLASKQIRDENAIEQLRQIARTVQIAMLVPYPEITDDDIIYNSAMLIDSTGQILLNYRKTHLWGHIEKEIFTPGENDECGYRLCELNSVRIGILICYDIEFPEPMRVLTLMGAQLILVPTALSTQSKTNENIPLLTIRCRAQENHVWIAYSNFYGRESPSAVDFCGLSCIVGPDGDDLARATLNGEDNQLLTADLCCSDIYEKRTLTGCPYLADRRPQLYEIIADTKVKFTLPENYSYR